MSKKKKRKQKKKGKNVEKEAQEKLGFTPPAFRIADKLGEDFKEVIENYYDIIYTDDVIPLKYKYLMAIATAIMAENN